MPETCGIKFQFSKLSHLFNLNSAAVTAAVTSVRSESKWKVEVCIQTTCSKVYDLWLLNDSKTCLFFLSDSDGDNELPLNPDRRPYKDDLSVPVFLRRKSAFSWEEIAKILLRKYDKEQVCLTQPINVSNNVSFLLDNSKFQNQSDIMCDNMGDWKHTGSPKICFTLSDKTSNISKCNTNNTGEGSKVYTLKRVYHRNTSIGDVRKIAKIRFRQVLYTCFKY